MRSFFLLFTLTLSALPAERPLADYLARRDYAAALTFYSQRLKKKPSNLSAVRSLARIYDHQRMFDSSLVWWERACELNPADDSSIIGRWNALYHRDEDDSAKLAVTKAAIAVEAAAFLAETTERNLTLAWQGLSLSDTLAGPRVAWLLASIFPESPAGSMIIGNSFYDSLYIQGIWYNDTLKVPAIRRFLGYFPKTEWRSTFYMFLLSSIYGLRDTTQALAVAKEMIDDDSLDPFRWRYAASILNRLQAAPELAESYARKAIALEPTARKPKNKPQEQWELDYPPLYGLARLSLAEALKAQDKLEDAKKWVNEAIAQFRWDPNQEATPGPFHCLQGEIQEAQGDTSQALDSYIHALQAGDSRNHWAARADTGLQRLGFASAREQLDLGRKLLNYAGAVFTDVTDSYGLSGRKESRVAWGDYNNDGYDDLLLSGCRLFRNDSGRSFVNVTNSVGLTDARGRGGVWADYDNDGWLDFYMAGADTVDRLWHNDSGRFHDATAEAGYPTDPYPTEGTAWADYDNDGYVDIYNANYEHWHPTNRIYTPDRLWHNEHGTFRDATVPAGVVAPYGKDLAGRGVNWGDYNDDGLQDCFVSNYRLCENFLWRNNGDGTFTNVAGQEGVSGDEVNSLYGHTIGSEWADYDNDGDLDLFTADLAHPRYIEFSNRSRLYQNRGPKACPRFVDRRAEAGIRYEETHSDPGWADVDNDGDLDLYITSIYEGRRSFLYENQARHKNVLPSTRIASPVPRKSAHGPGFSEITWLSGTRVFNGWGCAFSDFDNDGDMDLAVGSGSGVRLFRNDTENGHHWVKVKVVGTKTNRFGIGARVTVVERSRRRQIREVQGGKGTTSQNSLVQHFGLGRSPLPVTVEVRFGPGSVRRLTNVQPDQLLVVTE